VIAKLSKLPHNKDEFESTQAYTARLRAAQASLAKTYIISVPFDPAYAVYNADAQKFEVQSFALRNVNTDYSLLFGHRSVNLDLVVSRKEVPTGKYIGSNSYGARATIVKVKKVTKAIFEREQESWELEQNQALFFLLPKPGSIIIEISADPARARVLKASMRGAVIITPKPPFFLSGSVPHPEPTINDPRDISETLQVVIADFKCGLVMDGYNIVLGAREMR
jgi:hypothetical protein